jgi:DNA-binding GntR family transcriptional regulator
MQHGAGSIMNATREQSFRGAMDLVVQAEAATDRLKELCAACANGDKPAARRCLREAISELEIARAMLRTGLE